MGIGTTEIDEALPDPSSPSAREDVFGDIDASSLGSFVGDFKANFNPSWMIPDRAGHFCWYKKKQTGLSLVETQKMLSASSASDGVGKTTIKSGLFEAMDDSNASLLRTEATSFNPLEVDALTGGAVPWVEAKGSAFLEFTTDEDCPFLDRDDSFSRMLASAILAGKQGLETPVPEAPTVSKPRSPPPSPPPPSRPQQLPQPQSRPSQSPPLAHGRPRDWRGGAAFFGPQSLGAPAPSAPPRALPIGCRADDKTREDPPSAPMKSFDEPHFDGQMSSDALWAMVNGVVSTVSQPLAPEEPRKTAAGQRQARHPPGRHLKLPMAQPVPVQKRVWDELPSQKAAPEPLYSVVQAGGQSKPVGEWATFDDPVPAVLPPSAQGTRSGGHHQSREAPRQVPSASTIRSKTGDKRIRDAAVPGGSGATTPPTRSTAAPLLKLPLPPLQPPAPTDSGTALTHLGEDKWFEFPAAAAKRLTPPLPLPVEAPLLRQPSFKRPRDNSVLPAVRRTTPPKSHHSPHVKSSGWTQERTGAGVPFWFNRITGQATYERPASLSTNR